jgi:histidyl-tRNA synthetase
LDIQTEVKLDLTLARGLSYYTGAIFEVKALDVEIGSITGGGRYDDLTGIFGLKNMSGVGISFGADRIFDVMNQLNLFPTNNATTTQLLFVNFGEQEERYCLKILQQLRANGINAEIYPESAKMKKQMTYADKKGIPFVVLVGENEIQTETFTLKNMATGEQQTVRLPELIDRFLTIYS